MTIKNDGPSLAIRRLFSPGQPIILEGLSANGEEYERWDQYQSRIHKVLDHSLVVSSPRRRGTVVRFKDGSPLTVFVNRFGVRLRFQAVVLNSPDTPLVIHLMEISDLKRFDRRTHVRVQLLLVPTEFSIKGDPKKNMQTMAPRITDISVGGVGISCIQGIEIGTIIQLIIELPKVFGRIKASVEVCRVFDPVREAGGKKRWRIGAKFVDISEADLDRIAAFVTYQREKMKRVGVFSKLTGHYANEKTIIPSTDQLA